MQGISNSLLTSVCNAGCLAKSSHFICFSLKVTGQSASSVALSSHALGTNGTRGEANGRQGPAGVRVGYEYS